MRSVNLGSTVLWLLLLGAFVPLSGCSSHSDGKVSVKLCSIYEDMARFSEKPVSEKEGILAGKVQKEMPVFFDENYRNFMQIDWDKKAKTMQRLIGMIEGDEHYALCDPILEYYAIK